MHVVKLVSAHCENFKGFKTLTYSLETRLLISRCKWSGKIQYCRTAYVGASWDQQ